MPDYVTAEELAAMIGASADPERVALAAGAANLLVADWCPQLPDAEGTVPDAPVDDVTRQAARELAHGLFRAHAAVGGVFMVDDLVATLAADRVRRVRDLLDTRTGVWGLA